MIEKIILDWLGAKLDVSVYLEEPKNPPKEYVLIDKLGSAENDFITSATIAVQSYSASLYGAAELNAKVKRLCLKACHRAIYVAVRARQTTTIQTQKQNDTAIRRYSM